MPASVTSTSMSAEPAYDMGSEPPELRSVGHQDHLSCRLAHHPVEMRFRFEVRRDSDIDVDPVRAEDEAVEVHVPKALLGLPPVERHPLLAQSSPGDPHFDSVRLRQRGCDVEPVGRDRQVLASNEAQRHFLGSGSRVQTDAADVVAQQSRHGPPEPALDLEVVLVLLLQREFEGQRRAGHGAAVRSDNQASLAQCLQILADRDLRNLELSSQRPHVDTPVRLGQPNDFLSSLDSVQRVLRVVRLR